MITGRTVATMTEPEHDYSVLTWTASAAHGSFPGRFTARGEQNPDGSIRKYTVIEIGDGTYQAHWETDGVAHWQEFARAAFAKNHCQGVESMAAGE